MNPRNFLVRGLLAGLVSGVLTFAVAYVVGEPQIDAAISLEESGIAAAGPASHADEPGAADHEHAEAVGSEHTHSGDGTQVSRSNQSTWGLLTGTLSVAVALGGAVGLLSAFAVGRFGQLRPEQTTAMVAAIGFVSVALVPFLKYPASPPAVGNAETIGERTALFFALMAVSVGAAIIATIAGRRLAVTWSSYRGFYAAAAGYLVVVIVAVSVLPTVNELGDFPADTLWYFRRASLLTLLTMWTTIGLVAAALIHQLHRRESVQALRRKTAASL